MWTTPAPPSTALLPASTCAGTCDVNTSPGAAASSIPSPTKPPWSGSCPEPPPEISATLPRFGASLRTTICAAAAERKVSGCGAARPANDSLTIVAGSLRNLRIWLVSTAILSFLSFLCRSRARGRLFVGHGFLDRLLDDSRVREVVIGERGEGGSNEPRDEVDGDVLRPVGGAARERLHQLRTESTRGVERSAGDGAEDQDDPDDSAPDDQTRQLPRRAAVDDAEDGEQQQPGSEGFRERRLQVVRGAGVGGEVGLAHAEGHCVRSEHAPDGERADDAAGVLSDPVDGNFLPGEPLRHREGKRHRRVDVAARHLADRVDEGRDDEAESEADPQQVSLGHGGGGRARHGL